MLSILLFLFFFMFLLLVSFSFLILTATTAALMFVLLKQEKCIKNIYKRRKGGMEEGTQDPHVYRHTTERKLQCHQTIFKLNVLCAASALGLLGPNFFLRSYVHTKSNIHCDILTPVYAKNHSLFLAWQCNSSHHNSQHFFLNTASTKPNINSNASN